MQIITNLKKSLPEVLWRHRWPHYQELYGLPYSKGSMANYDCYGQGPIRGLVGRRVFYLKDDYLRWLEERLSSDREGPNNGSSCSLSFERCVVTGLREEELEHA